MKKTFQNVIVSIVLIPLSYLIMVFIHEFGHTILAWALGYLNSPFDIFFTTKDLFYVDNKINYDEIIKQGHHIMAAIIALIPNIVNPTTFLLSAHGGYILQNFKTNHIFTILYFGL